MSASEIIVVGIGIAGRDHVRALEHTPGATVIAAVDPQPSRTLTFQGNDVPVYKNLPAAVAGHHPNVVVVSTPTRTHAAVCDEVAEYFPHAEILVEKPVSDNLADARQLVTGTAARKPVHVAFHMAYSPEVAWGLTVASSRHADFGPPAGIQSSHSDPYEPDLESAKSRLGTSWIDTGINAISVIERFATVIERKSLLHLGEASWSAFEGVFACRTQDAEVDAVVLTNWHVTDPARTTRIKYASGAELVMDHTAVAGYVVQKGRIVDIFGSNGLVPRRELHYRALYQSWLIDRQELFSTEHSLRMHELILEPADNFGIHNH